MTADKQDDRPFCKDYGEKKNPPCLKYADPQYTMDFSDVEPGAQILWCSNCGPQAHAMHAKIMAFLNKSPMNLALADKLIAEAEARIKKNAN